MKIGDHTPWGPAQSVTRVGPDDTIWFIETASHGGYRLYQKALDKMPANLKMSSQFYKNDGWFEEDCEWARVALAFPELFPSEAQKTAKATLRAVHPGLID